MAEPTSNGWREEWCRNTTDQLKSLNNKYEKISDELSDLKASVAALKARVGIWSALGGAAVGGGVALVVSLAFNAS